MSESRPESSGKTTLTLQVIAAAQREGKTWRSSTPEHALDPSCTHVNWASILITCSCSLVETPASRHWKSVMPSACSGAVDVIVVDSVAALTPKAEIEGEIGDSHMGLGGTYDERRRCVSWRVT
ncbi:hypothetical protein ACNKHX_16435 [Shigella flexneri]